VWRARRGCACGGRRLLCTDHVECAVALCDLSLGGAGIETGEALAYDLEVAIFVEGLLPLAGRVRWCSDRRAGVEFHIPIQVDVLADWMGSNGETVTTS